MARARPVQGIRSKRSLRENAVLVIEQRLEEFLSWRGALRDESDVTGLHDMRIAAKRLRYALEIFEVCFPEAPALAKEMTQVQEDLGDIHDLDVLTDLLRARLRHYDTAAVDEAMVIAATSKSRAEQINRLRKLLYAQARERRRLGLLALIGEKVVERRKRYEKFCRRWEGARLDELRNRVYAGLHPQEDVQSTDQTSTIDTKTHTAEGVAP